jgi:hypothetical protein
VHKTECVFNNVKALTPAKKSMDARETVRPKRQDDKADTYPAPALLGTPAATKALLMQQKR